MTNITCYFQKISLLVLISIGTIGLLAACSKQATDQPLELPEYRIKGPEPYGSPITTVGSKFWINVPPGTTEEAIENLLEYQVRLRKAYKVTISGKSHLPSEMTFFIYNQLSDLTNKEKIPGEDIADVIYEWRRTSGVIRKVQ